jgi:hypothetical protein
MWTGNVLRPVLVTRRLLPVSRLLQPRRNESTNRIFIAVEFAQFSIAKEDAVDFFIHLFEPDLFVSEYFAYKNPALVPTDISTVVHSPRLKRP